MTTARWEVVQHISTHVGDTVTVTVALLRILGVVGSVVVLGHCGLLVNDGVVRYDRHRLS